MVSRWILPLGVAGTIALGYFSLQNGAPPVPKGVTELRYMAWGNPQQLKVEEQIIEEFNRENPDIRIRLFKVPGSSYGNKMIVMLASRTAPDIMRVDQYNFPNLVTRDYFLSLDKFIAKDPDYRLEDFIPQAVEECQYKGKQYAVNVLFGSNLVYYNKTMVKKAGLEDPYQLFLKDGWTWDAFVEYAKKMTTKDERGKYATFGAAIPVFPNYLATVYGFGGRIMDPETGRVTLNEKPALEALKYWHDLRFVHQAAPTPAQSANSAFSFESGKLGMHFDWMGMTPRYREATLGFDWDVVPSPSGPGGSVSAVKGNQLVINADSKHPEMAWKFLKFMVSEKIERMLHVKLRRCFPTRKSLAYSEEYLKTDLPPFNMKAFVYAVKTGRRFPITSRWGDWSGRFNSGLENLFLGNTPDTEKAINDAKKRAETALALREGL